MEGEFEAKVRMEQRQRSSSAFRSSNCGNLTFRAPQENFTLDDFDIGKVYGCGSYSKVLRAKKKDTGNVYALKMMDKKFVTKENKTSNVKLERIVLDQLDHPGIIRIFFTFQDNQSLYMALEACDGGELFDQITRKGRLSEDEARFYTAQVVDALEYLHGLGLIHRDIKPENLLLTADGHIKIADFGSLKATNSARINVIPDTTNDKASFVGTADYIPPEAVNASSTATFGNDLWALGCTLYQMLSGSSPFKDKSEWLIFQRIITRDLRFPDYFSDEASDLIDKLLDKDPKRRLGAGLDGYAALKFHPFFRGIDWGSLRKTSAPELSQESTASNGDGAQDDAWNRQSIVLFDRGGGTGIASSVPTSEAWPVPANLSSIDSFDSKWRDFLDDGETIIMISALKKYQKIKSKKVQLILTDKPKLICVDHNKSEKMKVLWSDNLTDLTIKVSNAAHFKIVTMKKVNSFEDPKERAWQWKKAVEGLLR